MGTHRLPVVAAFMVLATAACSASTPATDRVTPRRGAGGRVTSSAAPTAGATTAGSPRVRASRHHRAARPSRPSRAPHTRSSRATASRTADRHRRVPGRRLPLSYRTANARQVITVTASSSASTTARLQAWRAIRGGWHKVGPAVHAWLGYDGFSEPASETRSATPTGSFTLTHAFGADPDPGPALPYLHTTPADWWISESGRLYNTHQRCSSGCPFRQGSPNEHLYYETPYYNYAVVIDYNTRNSPTGVRQGRGSAFFLHVTVHQPTQGCVSIPQAQLVRLLRWLRPSKHPRILLGVDHRS